MNPNDQPIQVTVKNSEGETVKENWKKGEKQSDGSTWHIPIPIEKTGHVHNFLYDSGKRWAQCDCGRGGYVFPDNAEIRDGHIYRKNGELVI